MSYHEHTDHMISAALRAGGGYVHGFMAMKSSPRLRKPSGPRTEQKALPA